MPPLTAKLVGLHPPVPRLTLGNPQSGTLILFAPRILDMTGRYLPAGQSRSKACGILANESTRQGKPDLIILVYYEMLQKPFPAGFFCSFSNFRFSWVLRVLKTQKVRGPIFLTSRTHFSGLLKTGIPENRS